MYNIIMKANEAFSITHNIIYFMILTEVVDYK